jgi:putative hydrolase of the HAD superfamily
MINAVVFDLDGTLLDRDSSLKSFVTDQYERIDQLQKVKKKEYIRKFIELDNNGYVWKDKVYQQLIQEFKLDIFWKDLLDDYLNSFQNHCLGFSGYDEMLEELRCRDLKLAIISNGYGEFQYNNIRALGIEHYFEYIAISELEGIRKPDPNIFLNTLDKLNIVPEESIYVGDHPINDVAASRKVGMKALWKENKVYEAPKEHDGIIFELIQTIKYL